MMRCSNQTNSAPTRQPTAPRAMVEPMEGCVLMSATALGDPVTFTCVVTNTAPASTSAGSFAAESPTAFTPNGAQLVVTIKDGPAAQPPETIR
jgi:hypothetical protein